jgi:hypothetical protein
MLARGDEIGETLATPILEVETPPGVTRFAGFDGEECRSVNLHGTRSFYTRFVSR